jgi:proteasome lid subunit RPN8/RPN11
MKNEGITKVQSSITHVNIMENKTVIHLTDEALSQIYTDGEAAYPDECCGFLYGEDGEVRFIQTAVPVINSKEGDQRRRFEISPDDYRKAELYALTHDTQLLGVYHSHPDHPAIASIHDLEKALPYFSYVIVSVLTKKIADIKSWKLRDEERVFDEEKVIIQILK